MSDLEGSHPAVPLSLHVACRKWRGDQQEFPAAQAPVGLCTWGCPPPPPPPPPAHPPGQDAPGDSSSHQSRKTSSTGQFNLPPCWQAWCQLLPPAPPHQGEFTLRVFLGFMGISGFRDPQLGSRSAWGQFIVMSLG